MKKLLTLAFAFCTLALTNSVLADDCGCQKQNCDCKNYQAIEKNCDCDCHKGQDCTKEDCDCKCHKNEKQDCNCAKNDKRDCDKEKCSCNKKAKQSKCEEKGCPINQ